MDFDFNKKQAHKRIHQNNLTIFLTFLIRNKKHKKN